MLLQRIVAKQQAAVAAACRGGSDTLHEQRAAGALNSDHAPLYCEVPHLGPIVTWNVMTRMRADGQRVNNGFGATESEIEYEARIHRLAGELRGLAQRGAVAMLVQEAPADPRLADTLAAGLPRGWRALASGTRGERFGQMILYASTKLRVVPLALPSIPGPQDGRVQSVALQHRGDVVAVSNVHFKWGLPCEDALQALAWGSDHTVIGGDFNRPIATVELAGTRAVHAGEPTSFKYTPQGPELCAVDGFLLRL